MKKGVEEQQTKRRMDVYGGHHWSHERMSDINTEIVPE